MSQPLTPTQEWWTAEEIAAAGLPDLPATRQGCDALIKRLQWRGNPVLARRREGKGGGWEYSWQLFPDRARRKLLQAAASAVAVPEAPARQGRDEAWTWYEGLPQGVKSKAESRLRIVQQVEAMEIVQGRGRHLAVVDVARVSGVGARTVWTWFQMIEGVRSDDRLPYLAPRNRAAADRQRSKDFDPEFFDLIASDYLRLEAPTFSDCYRRALRIAKKNDWDTLPERTMRRRLDATVSMPTQVMHRKGWDAVKRMYPPQMRDKSALHPLEGVNGDNHRIDVFVRWPAPKGEEPQIVRPQLMVWQDIYSGFILAWRCDLTANSTAVLLAAGDMIEAWGIPEHVLVDNGREFAAKAVTGGASTRFRFKVKEDDVPGLFVNLGCQIHWATPYSGQSKPIERAFRDFCQSIAKDPRFAGAYTGNKPDAKPENYGSNAIDLEEFLVVVAEGIEEHNTRQGRRSEVAFGRSFADVFAEGYATAPIRKATDAQRRLWLMGAEAGRASTTTGEIKFQGNRFWEPWMHELAGKRVIIRFDPEAFCDGLHVYSSDGAYQGFAPCIEKAGFFNSDEARAHARARGAWKKAVAAEGKALRKYRASEIGVMMTDSAPAAKPMIEAKVVKPIFGRGKGAVADDISTAAAPAYSDERIAAVQAEMIHLDSRRAAPVEAEDETPRKIFQRAIEMERQQAAGAVLTKTQMQWLASYQTTADYIAQRQLLDDFGDVIFG